MPVGSNPAHAIPGRRPVAEALRAGRRLHSVLLGPRGAADLEEAAVAAGVEVRRCPRDQLDSLSRGVVHQDVVALAPAYPYCRLDQVADTDIVVALDQVTDPQNLGSIARSAELAGAGALVLPQRRSVHVTPAAEKAAAGAFSWLQVALVPSLVRALADLAQRGFWSVGLDPSATQAVWESPLLDGRCALVIGAEGSGLSRLVAERVDALVTIPTRGRLGSLNAAAAAAVVLFEITRRHQS